MDQATTLLQPTTISALTYLVIGHVTADLTPTGIRLGGTAAFSGLTAQALGLRTGIITACAPELNTLRIKSCCCLQKLAHNPPPSKIFRTARNESNISTTWLNG